MFVVELVLGYQLYLGTNLQLNYTIVALMKTVHVTDFFVILNKSQMI